MGKLHHGRLISPCIIMALLVANMLTIGYTPRLVAWRSGRPSKRAVYTGRAMEFDTAKSRVSEYDSHNGSEAPISAR